MTQFELPNVVTVQVKDHGSYEFDTAQWSPEFVVAALTAAVRFKFDAKRNSDGFKKASPSERDKALQAIVDAVRKGEFKARATQAATLDQTEKELRRILAKAFFDGGYQKKSEVAQLVTKVDRWDQYRDLIIKRQLQQLATSPEELAQLIEKLQLRVDNAKQQMTAAAERAAEAIMKIYQETEVDPSSW